MQGLARLSVMRPVFATVLILALGVIGLISIPKLGVDRFPNVDVPYVTITTKLTFKMQAMFFAAEFDEESGDGGEQELHRLPIVGAETTLFHTSHAWAVRQVQEFTPNRAVPLP